MRAIDADALKENMFLYAAPEMVWDRGDIEHKINEMPTIDAIPVEWLRQFQDKMPNTAAVMGVDVVLKMWEQEAR